MFYWFEILAFKGRTTLLRIEPTEILNLKVLVNVNPNHTPVRLLREIQTNINAAPLAIFIGGFQLYVPKGRIAGDRKIVARIVHLRLENLNLEFVLAP